MSSEFPAKDTCTERERNFGLVWRLEALTVITLDFCEIFEKRQIFQFGVLNPDSSFEALQVFKCCSQFFKWYVRILCQSQDPAHSRTRSWPEFYSFWVDFRFIEPTIGIWQSKNSIFERPFQMWLTTMKLRTNFFKVLCDIVISEYDNDTGKE